jgi:hypothetical protein
VLCCVLLTFSNLNRDIEQSRHWLFVYTRLHKESAHSSQNNIYLISYYVKGRELIVIALQQFGKLRAANCFLSGLCVGMEFRRMFAAPL